MALLRSRRPNRIAVQPEPGSVASRNAAEEADPAAVGSTVHAIEHIWSAVEALYASGVHPAIQLCIRRRGAVVLDRAIGHARGNSPGDDPDGRKVRATPQTPFCIFSCSKAITATAIHMLDDRGVLHVDDRVADFLPEFAQHGKEWVTLRHVLTHRAGIPSIPVEEFDPTLLLDERRVVELLCEAKPVSAPGRRLAYHAVTGGFVLGEVVRRVTGRDLRQWLRDELLDPLGFRDLCYGLDPARHSEVAVNAFTGRPPPAPLARVIERALGVPMEEAVRISNTPEWLEAIVPSGNVIGTANELSRFFQLLLNGGTLDGTQVFEPRLVRRAVTETSYLEVDFTVLFPVRYGIGLMLGSDRVSAFGPHTPRAFGHHGFINCFGWADPERDLAVGLLTSGKPFVSGHLPRLLGVLAAISKAFPRDGRA